MATDIRVRLAPAKVNLTLAVLGPRRDGFHDIESWVVPIDWCDRLTLARGEGLALTLRAERLPGVPSDGSNIVWQAAEALARAADRPADVAITLDKRIPPGAGLGGGSSDAAAALLGLNQLWGLDWPIEALAPIAAELGSDVPLFLNRGPAVIRGRGERVERLSARRSGWLALILPPYRLSTAAVYRAWSQTGTANLSQDCGTGVSPVLIHRPEACESRGLATGAASEPAGRKHPWRAGSRDADTIMPGLFNDLEPAAFAVEPRLARLHASLDGLGGRRVRMTGSGSTLFTLFSDRRTAEAWCAEAESPAGGADLRVVAIDDGCRLHEDDEPDDMAGTTSPGIE